MMKAKTIPIYPLLIFFVMISITSTATTIDDLLLAEKVRIKAWVEPDENIMARQQVNLQIEIATDKWFSGGTRIGAFEVEDAIVLQRERFAVNSSRNEYGKTWTVQEWTIAVYPQRHGQFKIPEVPVKVSIAGENLESIVGDLTVPSFSFIVNLPAPYLDGMSSSTNWVATTRLEVTETYDKTFEELQPGDAVVRSIRMSADNLPAMMLPEVDIASVAGIAVYPKPPQLQDKVNRGTYLAERSQTITYVVERAGLYLLPRKTFYWWNLGSQSFESIELEARAFEVVDLSGIENPAEQPIARQTGYSDLILLLMKFGIASLLVILVGITIHGLSTSSLRSPPTTRLSEAELRRKFDTACRKNNLEQAMGLFYQWLDNHGGSSFKGTVREQLDKINKADLNAAFANIMQAVYSPQQKTTADLRHFARQFIKELKKSDHQPYFSQFRIELKLN